MKSLFKIMFVASIFLITYVSTVNASIFVTGDGIRVRSSAQNLGDSNVIGKLNYGDIPEIIGKEGSWYRINYNGTIGYITTTFTSDSTTMFSSRVTGLINKNVNLKQKASSSSKSICSIPKKSVVKVGETISGWTKVSYNGKVGYVKKSVITRKTSNTEVCLGTYSLSYSLSNSNRSKNISKAIKKLNGYTVTPRGTFSFIKAVGKSGYSKAPEFNKKSRFSGGGLSHVATSLYQAVRDAQKNGIYISVKDRTRHTSKTPYAVTGEEAMIYLNNNTDFTFKNCSSNSMRIYAYVSGNNVSFIIAEIR